MCSSTTCSPAATALYALIPKASIAERPPERLPVHARDRDRLDHPGSVSTEYGSIIGQNLPAARSIERPSLDPRGTPIGAPGSLERGIASPGRVHTCVTGGEGSRRCGRPVLPGGRSGGSHELGSSLPSSSPHPLLGASPAPVCGSPGCHGSISTTVCVPVTISSSSGSLTAATS